MGVISQLYGPDDRPINGKPVLTLDDDGHDADPYGDITPEQYVEGLHLAFNELLRLDPMYIVGNDLVVNYFSNYIGQAVKQSSDVADGDNFRIVVPDEAVRLFMQKHICRISPVHTEGEGSALSFEYAPREAAEQSTKSADHGSESPATHEEPSITDVEDDGEQTPEA